MKTQPIKKELTATITTLRKSQYYKNGLFIMIKHKGKTYYGTIYP